jgi:hypothetical protein
MTAVICFMPLQDISMKCKYLQSCIIDFPTLRSQQIDETFTQGSEKCSSSPEDQIHLRTREMTGGVSPLTLFLSLGFLVV